MTTAGSRLQPDSVRDRLRERGLRWTPQRRAILEALASAAGHVTAADLLDRCRAVDPEVTASTVYRTLDTLEELGLVVHSHGRDGREEYHVVPAEEHAHLVCERCGSSWEVGPDELSTLVENLRRARAFTVSVSHLSISGVCASCANGATVSGPTRPMSG
ncbi:MAG TPA: Fur family transcriptional regulator [Candidatus Limnocylindrales bacterium]|nr:Fur family transcriptional regulator [Candidatus Limnocylindrales bacterium]